MRIRLVRAALVLFLPGAFLGEFQTPVSASPDEATRKAAGWFFRNKAPDGALPGYDNGYTVGGTADGILALEAAGESSPSFRRKAEDTPVDYLEAHAADDTPENDPRDDAHLAGKVALAAAVAGADPRNFGGVDLVRFIQARYDSSTGGYRGGFQATPINPLGQGLAVLGLAAAGERVPARAVDYLLGAQQPDGGWELGAGFGSDVTTSSMAVQALAAAARISGKTGPVQAAWRRSSSFFSAQQNEDGGFSNQKQHAGNFCSGQKPSEADATAFAVQWMRTVGDDTDGAAWAKPGKNGPREFLRSLQKEDGSFSFQQGPDCPGNGGSTYASMLGIEKASFPCLIAPQACRAPAPRGVSGSLGRQGRPGRVVWVVLGAVTLLAGWIARQLLKDEQ